MTVSPFVSALQNRRSNNLLDAFEQVVVPALDIYKPELILVSSGFGKKLALFRV